eukprot:TRINITY_DN9910_c0_g1_i1.p1 TRINITY_DN9910_c0_g1~~TRINITY_DN9910_c0_g1_i1.p1  ORF type:complete len:167 (+),score=7.43 TRINITY_DN9910_c0_g1_i1:271-771(+)
MAATLLQRSVFSGTVAPLTSARSAALCVASQPRYAVCLPLARSNPVSDASKHATSSQRSQDSLPAFQSQDITLLGSSSGQAFETFWDNVLSEGESKARSKDGAAEAVDQQQTRTNIGKEDWRAVRRVVDFDSQKAKELRRKLRETESFHDTFYHSHVAEMLANPID